MSSPATFYDPPSSPPILPSVSMEADDESMPAGRPMRVKVLYTFDDDNKTNCLARFPNALNVPTVALDDNTQIGVIELKKCIEAIVNASPELVAKLGQDYTVYAYDYSEYETPLVGQGLLSWVLASASSTPDAPAHQSSTMITGRVCKNIMGIFSNGVKETLEVKLRLVPVPTCLQSEYLASLEKYRNASEVPNDNIDPNAWASVMNGDSSNGQMMYDSTTSFNRISSAHEPPTGSLEDIHHLLTQGRNNHTGRTHNQDDSFTSDVGYSTQASRAGSPTPSQRSTTAPHAQPMHPPIRPSSRASISSNRSFHRRQDNSSTGGREEQDISHQDGPARKRARIERAEWKGKSSNLGTASSLRVTASTANSVRMQQPVPIRPSGGRTISLEPPPRVPTPIPGAGSKARPLLRTASTSQLRRASTMSSDGGYSSPYNADEFHEQTQHGWAGSPPDLPQGSAITTPSDIPSSPPVFDDPTSPILPSYPLDSGFMSGTIADPANDDNEDRPIDEDDVAVTMRYKRRPKTARPDKDGFCTVLPGPSELLPQRIPEKTHEAVAKRQMEEAARAQKAQDKQGRYEGRGKQSTTKSSTHNSQQSQVPCDSVPLKKEPSVPIERRPSDTPSLHLPMSNTQPQNPSQPLNRPPSSSNDALQSLEHGDPLRSTLEVFGAERTSSSAAASRRRIANKLAESLQKGESPPYCRHCGEINTPTWRLAFAKTMEGEMPKITFAGGKGDITALQSLEQDESGKTTKYLVVKKLIDENVDQNYQPIQLCNPCGLWLSKLKGMRPQKVWHKSSVDRRRREFLKKMSSERDREPQSDFGPTTMPMLGTDQLSPFVEEVTLTHERAYEEQETLTEISIKKEPNSDKLKWDQANAATALKRAIQSSPARLLGSQQTPIELDDEFSPKPTRRLLFPSPRRNGEMKTLDGSVSPCTTQSPQHKNNETPLVVADESQHDKENCPPPLCAEDDLNDIFQDINFPLVKTPEKKARSPAYDNPLKTPTPASKRRDVLTPNMSANRVSRTPSSKRGTSASKLLQTLLSPSQAKDHQQMTPFTAQLNRLLADSINSPSARSNGKFDLSDLPPLSFDDLDGFGDGGFGSGFDTDFYSTDQILPTSPPPNMKNTFGVYEDPVEEGEKAVSENWNSLFGDSPKTTRSANRS